MRLGGDRSRRRRPRLPSSSFAPSLSLAASLGRVLSKLISNVAGVISLIGVVGNQHTREIARHNAARQLPRLSRLRQRDVDDALPRYGTHHANIRFLFRQPCVRMKSIRQNVVKPITLQLVARHWTGVQVNKNALQSYKAL